MEVGEVLQIQMEKQPLGKEVRRNLARTQEEQIASPPLPQVAVITEAVACNNFSTIHPIDLLLHMLLAQEVQEMHHRWGICRLAKMMALAG